MERIEFGNINQLAPNSNRKNEVTYHGAIEIYTDFQRQGYCSLDIRGPVKSYRGSAIFDRETARKVGLALLQWSFA